MSEPTKANKLTESQWRDLCAEWEASSEPQKQFCAKHSIRYAQFVSWRSKILAERGETRVKKFTPLRVERSASAPSRQQSGLVMKLPNGIVLHISAETSKQSLQITLDALGITRC